MMAVGWLDATNEEPRFDMAGQSSRKAGVGGRAHCALLSAGRRRNAADATGGSFPAGALDAAVGPLRTTTSVVVSRQDGDLLRHAGLELYRDPTPCDDASTSVSSQPAVGSGAERGLCGASPVQAVVRDP